MSEIIDWLLEDNSPSVKYRTLTEIMGVSEEKNEIMDLYEQIWQQNCIRKIFSRQNANGIWEHSEKEYGVHTSMRYLTTCAELGLKKDSRINKAVEYTIMFLKESLEPDIRHDYSGCSNALILRALVMLGYHEETDVRILLEHYFASQLFDGGFICKRLMLKKPERKSCFKAATAALLLYAECKRKGILPENADNLHNYFYKRDIFYTSDKSRLIADGRQGWRFIDNFFPVESMRIGLPQIMAALSILGGGNHPAATNAWDFLREKRKDDGRMILEGTLTKQPCSFGKVGEPNKWVTFYAELAKKYSYNY